MHLHAEFLASSVFGIDKIRLKQSCLFDRGKLSVDDVVRESDLFLVGLLVSPSKPDYSHIMC